MFYSDEVVVTATRSSQSLSQVTDNVIVITSEELEKWPASDLDEALGMITGIVIQDDGHLGQVATAQIYGSKAREVRVMVDGITFNATSTGGIADISQIPLDLVEKIEIIKGASSAVWGSALGGVINIITKPVGKDLIPILTGDLSYGEFRTERAKGEVSGKLGPLQYFGFGSYTESGGFRPNGDSLEKRAYMKAQMELLEDLAYFQGAFGYSGTKNGEFELSSLGIESARKVYSRYGNAGFTLYPADDWYSEVFYKISERSFRRDFDLLTSGMNFRHLKARSIIHEVSTTIVWEISPDQKLVTGSDIGVEVLRSSNITLGTQIISLNENSTRHAYYSNYQISKGVVDMTVGSRLDASNTFGVNFNPSAGVVFHLPNRKARLRANVSRAFNAPSLVDRFVSIGTIVANPDLKAETAVAYNIGVEAEPITRVRTKAVFFQTHLDDAIQTVTRTDGFRQAVNVNSERRTGFETDLEVGPWYGVSSSYGMAYVKAVQPGRGPIQARPRLTHDIRLNFERKIRGVQLNAHLVGRYTDLVTYSSGGFTDPIDQVFIFDGKIMMTFLNRMFGKFAIYLEGENLFNEDFAFDGDRDPNPQRNFEAGIRFTLQAPAATPLNQVEIAR